MLFAFMPIDRGGETRMRLCFTPDKPDILAKPILVDDLFPTNCAVIRVGQEEALVVSAESTESTIILNAIEPSYIFLTPNVAQFPGMRTRYLKVQRYSDGSYRAFYSKDKGKWEDWVPNRERS